MGSQVRATGAIRFDSFLTEHIRDDGLDFPQLDSTTISCAPPGTEKQQCEVQTRCRSLPLAESGRRQCRDSLNIDLVVLVARKLVDGNESRRNRVVI